MAYRSYYILLRDKWDHPRGTLVFNIIDNDGDVAPLSEVECYLLYSIDSAADRYEVYNTPGKLEWGVVWESQGGGHSVGTTT